MSSATIVEEKLHVVKEHQRRRIVPRVTILFGGKPRARGTLLRAPGGASD
jgi:hypothetical protein